MTIRMNRRQAIAMGITSVAALSIPNRADAKKIAPPQTDPALVKRHDDALQQTLDAQVTDAQSRWCGSVPDGFDIHYCTTAGQLLKDGAAAYFHPQSKYHGSPDLLERMKLAIGFLERSQSADGNIDLPSTNFNSPPDTGFTVHSVASAAELARMNKDKVLVALLEPFLRRAGDGLAKGGIHTPNHRWVVSAALAQIHDLFPDKRYVKRIDQWLAESVDIDDEGQFIERSTAGYNTVVDTALLVIAHKLKRPELLDPVRKNLDAMAYLLHPNGEVVTEISLRQDANTRGTMSGYWFVLRYLALRDKNGMYASMLAPLEPDNVGLARLMEYPELTKPLPAPAPIPGDYEREYPLAGITRVRRGKTSATIIHKGSSRWFALRRGGAVINAVRFAASFFGKGQFVPAIYEKKDDGFYFKQEIMGRYLQPISDPALLPVRNDQWSTVVAKRKLTEVCHLVYEARIRETAQGFEIDIDAKDTANVPLAVEINFREGGEFTGVTPAPSTGDAFLLKDGFAEYRLGADVIRFGPGHCEHAWVQLRGAEGKLPGPSVYITGYTPFKHTLTFQMT